MFKGLGNMAGMVKQVQEMQGRMKEMQENLSKMRVTATAGGDLVKAEVTGEMKLTLIEIDPSLIESGDKEMIEDLVVAATNLAVEKMKATHQEEMSKVTGGMDMPGMGDALSQFGLK
ncbi:Nucleoid-associated protein [Polystyrenella longa]|uniref:Nucleoid-associated protein Pla110_05290 n=1 Tax=Polystyrenella longa TaxID=2528007 RepID=A0A518CHX2_9PLAN|nr:YbaB/EbfC family nucleoid-associated protein [Polystyrenella longa]QDU78825.1 Nucleoid-associated protein [Polystyrenella longa]